mgnify:CR=1 FL=1
MPSDRSIMLGTVVLLVIYVGWLLWRTLIKRE